MKCLYGSLLLVNSFAIVALCLYLGHQNHRHELIGDISTCVYRTIVIILCRRFMYGLTEGALSEKEYMDLEEKYDILRSKKRKRTTKGCCNIFAYFFGSLQLNQFTIACVLSATHQLYNAGLLWVAVYDGNAQMSYIVK